MNVRKTVNGLANDEAKHWKKGNKLWSQSYGEGISSKRAKSLRMKAKSEYCKADSIRTAQGNLPNISSNITIASNNKIKKSKSVRVNGKINVKSEKTKPKKGKK